MVVCAEAVTTSAGEQTTTYLDIPGVLRDGKGMDLIGRVMLTHLLDLFLDDDNPVTMVVGPMTGSIPVVMGLAARFGTIYGDDLQWAIIRDEIKDHGLGRTFVGAEPGPDDKVIIVDDVASSGKSLLDAYHAVTRTGARVAAVVPLVDRGTRAGKFFVEPYLPVLTYKDLGIEAL